MKRLFVVAALIYGSYATAQQAEEKRDTASLNEVVVTATKFPIKTSATGKVIIVINRQDIDRSGSRDLAQILTEQGGIYINGATGNTGKDKSLFVRGGRVEHTLITIDGVPVYDATGIGSNFDMRNISIDAVERIEILKGSQSTLYGSDAIAGVVNIITRKSGDKPFSVYGMLSGGSYATLKANAGLSGRVKGFDYHLGYSVLDTEGISEAEQHKDSAVRFDKDGYIQNSFVANLGWQVAPSLRIQPYLRYTKNRGDYDAQGWVDAPNRYGAENLQAGVRNEWTGTPVKLALLYNFTSTNRDYSSSFEEAQYKGGEHFGELNAVYPIGQVKFTAGIDLRHSTSSFTSTSAFVQPLGKDSSRQTQKAVYAAINWTEPKGFALELGGRLNHHSVYGSNLAFNVNPSYLIGKQWKVFANVSSGYRTPSLYQLFSEYGNRQLDPETSLNLEGGVQVFSKDEKASVRGLYFQRSIKEAITFFFDPATFASRYINQDKQRDRGLELDARISFDEKLQLKLFYAYVDGEVATKTAGKDTTYFNLFRRPQNTLTLQAGSQLTKAFFISANIQWFSNTKDVSFEPPFYEQQIVKLKNYALINLYAEYVLLPKKLRLFADVRNLTDSHYQTIYGYASPRFNAYGGFRFSI